MFSYLVLLFIRKIDSLSGGPFVKFDEMQNTLPVRLWLCMARQSTRRTSNKKAEVVFEAFNIEHCRILAELPREGTKENQH